MTAIFFLLAILIAYGSFYPFDFQVPDTADLSARLDYFLSVVPTGRGDLLGNLVLFVPFGLTGMLAYGNRANPVLVISILGVGGGAFAAALQVGQLLLPMRDPSAFDFLLNLTGLAVGIGAALHPRLRDLTASRNPFAALPVSFLIGAVWPLGQLLPLIPTIDFANVKDSIKPVLALNSFSFTETLLFFFAWLASVHLLAGPPLKPRHAGWIPAVPVLVLCAQPFILGAEITTSEVAGTTGAIAAWYILGHRLSPTVISIGLIAITIVSNLLPWEPSFDGQIFSLVPFSGFLEGNMLTNTSALLKKLFLYGAAIWLLQRGGLHVGGATAFVTISLFAQEVAQTMRAVGTPEITDPMLAVALGVLFHLVARSEKGSVPVRQDSGSQHRAVLSPGEPDRELGAEAAEEELLDRESSQPSADSSVLPRHIPGLDGLRAFAALSVFAVHFQQAVNLEYRLGPFDLDRWLTNGNTGVALFFVLSGFLLTMPFLVSDRGGGRPGEIPRYLAKRLARIVPAYYLCLFALLGFDLVRGSLPSINNILSHLLFVYNINDWNILSINEPFWTLAAEVQFYLLLPFVILLVRRLATPTAFLFAVALAIGSYLVNLGLVSFLLARDQWPIEFTILWPFSVYISGAQSFVLTYSTLAHLNLFFMGIAISVLFVAGYRTGKLVQGAGSATAEAIFWVCALSVFVVLSTPLDDLLQVPHGRYNWPYVPLLLAGILLTAPQTRIAKSLLGWAPLSYLGLISYGIYVFHYPIQKGLGRLMSSLGYSVTEHWLLFGGASLLLTIAVASVSYFAVERPVMRWVRGRGDGPGIAAVRPQVKISKPPRRPAAETRKSRKGRGSRWIQIQVNFTQTHWSALHRFAQQRRLSSSGAVRLLLNQAIHGDSDERGPLPVAHRDSSREVLEYTESCRVNLRYDQVCFLEQIAGELDLDEDAFFAQLIDRFIPNPPEPGRPLEA